MASLIPLNSIPRATPTKKNEAYKFLPYWALPDEGDMSMFDKGSEVDDTYVPKDYVMMKWSAHIDS